MFFLYNKNFQRIFAILIIVMTLLASFFDFAQGTVNEQKCQSLLQNTEKECQSLTKKQCQSLLNQCLDFYQKQSDFYKDRVGQTQAEKNTLQNQIKILNSRISQYNNEIRKSSLMISDLTLQIRDTQESINITLKQIEESKERLAELLRMIAEQDKRSLVEIMLAEEKLSGFFDELAALEALSIKNQEILQSFRDLKARLEISEASLNKEKGELEHTVVANELQKTRSDAAKKEQEALLRKTKGQEVLYQEHLKEVEKKASEIRKKIFQLAQVDSEQAPSYEQAYELAKYVESVTGVRPALILGLLQMESAIGKNVGQCNCAGRANCRHPNLTYKDVMHKNQWASFEKITKELGMNVLTTPVSCSISGNMVQWGGAMGPAQFMPNTWLRLGYKERVAAHTGQPANPWVIRDAFLAAGLYLKDWGADTRILQREIGAVTAYLCGTSTMTNVCRNAGGVWYRRTIMNYADEWEKWIADGVFKK